MTVAALASLYDSISICSIVCLDFFSSFVVFSVAIISLSPKIIGCWLDETEVFLSMGFRLLTT